MVRQPQQRSVLAHLSISDRVGDPLIIVVPRDPGVIRIDARVRPGLTEVAST